MSATDTTLRPALSDEQVNSHDDDDDFDWSSDWVAIPEQLPVAVYGNSSGEIVIRQQAVSCFQDRDPFVVVARDQLPRLLNALREVAAMIETESGFAANPLPDCAEPETKAPPIAPTQEKPGPSATRLLSHKRARVIAALREK